MIEYRTQLIEKVTLISDLQLIEENTQLIKYQTKMIKKVTCTAD